MADGHAQALACLGSTQDGGGVVTKIAGRNVRHARIVALRLHPVGSMETTRIVAPPVASQSDAQVPDEQPARNPARKAIHCVSKHAQERQYREAGDEKYYVPQGIER